MRTLKELLHALNADAHEDARAIKIYAPSQVHPAPAGWNFVAVNPGESNAVPISDEEKTLLLDNQATHDDRQIYGPPHPEG